MTDVELLRAWADGDAAAGNTLFRRHFDTLFRFFSTKVDGPADDLVQETFLACLRGSARFEARASFRTYMLRIARNRLCEYYRGKRRAFSPHEDSVVDAGASPSTVLGAKEREGRLLAALRQLPLDFQLTLELFYWEGMKTHEIAEVLDISPHTTRSRLARARDRLREALATLELVSADDLATLEREADFDAWARQLRP
ncbi:MAG: RNA polymerase sigma factor [Nannocystaceae bacterium]|nr:sigma-70 family RNA polymerase sigma factor [bacterium]